jgi:hypothetical protein
MMISQVNTPPPSEVADLTSSALQNAGDKAKLLQLLAPVQQASEGLKKVKQISQCPDIVMVLAARLVHVLLCFGVHRLDADRGSRSDAD